MIAGSIDALGLSCRYITPPKAITKEQQLHGEQMKHNEAQPQQTQHAHTRTHTHTAQVNPSLIANNTSQMNRLPTTSPHSTIRMAQCFTNAALQPWPRSYASANG